MPGAQAKGILGIEEWFKKWDAANMVVMGVGEKQIGVYYFAAFHQLVAEISQARSGIKYKQAVAATNFKAGCVAAVADGIGVRDREAASNAPKFYTEIAMLRHNPALSKLINRY